jgi:hypothetical protein
MDDLWVEENIEAMEKWLKEQVATQNEGSDEYNEGFIFGFQTAMERVLEKHNELWHPDPSMSEEEFRKEQWKKHKQTDTSLKVNND